MSRDGYFLKVLIIVFCVCVDGFQGLSKNVHFPIQLQTFLFASLKLLINLKMLTETLLILVIPFSVIDQCYLESIIIGCRGKCIRINLSQAASGLIYRITGGFLYAFSVSKLPLKVFEEG